MKKRGKQDSRDFLIEIQTDCCWSNQRKLLVICTWCHYCYYNSEAKDDQQGFTEWSSRQIIEFFTHGFNNSPQLKNSKEEEGSKHVEGVFKDCPQHPVHDGEKHVPSNGQEVTIPARAGISACVDVANEQLHTKDDRDQECEWGDIS